MTDEAVDADREIFRRPVPASRSDAEWRLIVDRLLGQLEAFLGAELESSDWAVVDGAALSCMFRSAQLPGPLRTVVRGIVGLETVDGAPNVHAFLFLYSDGRPLVVAGEEGSYLECTYGPGDSGGSWNIVGWKADEYGEFAAFRAPLDAAP